MESSEMSSGQIIVRPGHSPHSHRRGSAVKVEPCLLAVLASGLHRNTVNQYNLQHCRKYLVDENPSLVACHMVLV
jgi:hypothetical protein